MKNVKKILIVMIMMLLVAFGFWLRGCVDVDSCLDRGGRWNYEKGVCEYQESEQGTQKK